MKIHKKRRNKMSATEAVKSSKEYLNIPIVELTESSTNPRKVFDEERLEELAGSIRSKGVLSPLLVRRIYGHFEIVTGHGAIAPRSGQGWTKSRSALEHSPMRRPLKFKSSRIFKEPTCIRSRKRKGFALCWTERVRITPLRRSQRKQERLLRSSLNASSSWTSHNPQPMPSPPDTSVSSTPY